MAIQQHTRTVNTAIQAKKVNKPVKFYWGLVHLGQLQQLCVSLSGQRVEKAKMDPWL
jgi:hypothetical protein